MFTLEFLISIISCFLPLIVGFLAFIGLGRLIDLTSFFSSFGLYNSKTTAFRLYECATYSRLSNLFSYSINNISIFLAFIVYDIDLIFFLPSSSYINNFGFIDHFIWFLFLFLFALGIYYDKQTFGFNWIL